MDPSDALARFIRWVMRDTLYQGSYSAEVQRQHDDGTVDLLPDDERLRGNGLPPIPIRYGVPGVEVRVRIGATVQLEFENGDPRRPFATFWEPGAIDSIRFDGGDKPIARVGDPVRIYWPPMTFSKGVIGIPPAANPFQATLTIASTVDGIIDGGKDNVLA